MVQDMTEGKPLKMILSFSIPLLIGNLFQQLYNMADSVIVGRMVGRMHWRRWELPVLSFF